MNCWITELYVKEFINKDMSERRAINIVELASTLADKELRQMVLDSVTNKDKVTLCKNGIDLENENGEIHYTEEAQEIFNTLYTEYTEIIEKSSY